MIVVGAGVLGAFHAYFAARRGLQVLLVERSSQPNQASVRNFGMIPQSIVDPEGPWAKYAQSSAEIYWTIQQECDISVSQRGSLYIASTELESLVLQEFTLRYADRYGCLFFDRRDLLARFPYVHQSYARGGLVFPRDLGLDPRFMLSRLIPYIEELGVEYIPNTAVTAIDVGEDRCTARTAWGDTLVAEHVFICSGADVTLLFPAVFVESDLRMCKLQMMRTVAIPEVVLSHSVLSGLSIRRYPAFTSCPSYSRLQAEPIDEKLRDYGIHVLIKQEADGSVVIGDSHAYASLADMSMLLERTHCGVNATILEYAKSMIRLPTWQLNDSWNGYYLVHPTDPIFAATLDKRIHIVTGIGGKGMSTGPGFARASIETVLA